MATIRDAEGTNHQVPKSLEQKFLKVTTGGIIGMVVAFLIYPVMWIGVICLVADVFTGRHPWETITIWLFGLWAFGQGYLRLVIFPNIKKAMPNLLKEIRKEIPSFKDFKETL
jgi:hypothetical protein